MLAQYTVWTYVAYLIISTGLTVWVARTLQRNGQLFLVDAFSGNEPLATSVNHLLVVGFYLINIGYVTLALSYGDKPTSVQSAIEFLSWKVGLVLVVLGVMHFFNLAVFSDMRRRGITRTERAALIASRPTPPTVDFAAQPGH
jgi:hypothetical protein